jgi:hypothetical protein
VGGVVVHRARLLPRLLLVLGLVAIPVLIVGLATWFVALGTAEDVGRAGRVGSPGVTTPELPGVTAAPRQVGPPEGWPDALAPPDGATVVTSVAAGAGEPDEQLVMVVEVHGEGPAVGEALRAQLATAGLTITSDALGPGGVGALMAAGAGWEASIAVAPDPVRPGVVTISWVLRRGLR